MVTSFNEAYDEINAFSIKEEINLEERQVVRDLWELEVKSLTAAEPNTKCGEVILENNQKFTLICTLCTNQYDDLEAFGKHIIYQHLETTLNLEYKPLDNLYVNELFQGPIYSQTLENEPCQDPIYSPTRTEVSAPNSPMHLVEQENAELNTTQNTNETVNQNGEVAEKDVKQFVVKLTNKEIFACTICGCAYSHKRSYLAHARKRHGLLTKRMKEKLQQQAVHDSKISEDAATDSGDVLASTPQEFQCEICPRSYRYKRSLLAHSRTAHGDDSSNASSSATNSQIISTETNQLQENVFSLAKIGSEKKEYAYVIDEKSFEMSPVLKNHNSHKTKRRHKCPHCPKRFTLTENLADHMKTHQNIQYSCKFCSKSFVKTTDKDDHELRYHIGERPFQCEDCGLRFLTRSRLARHVKRHQNIRQYKCSRCDKAFFEAYTLNSHMVVHSGERPFQCKVCARSFPRKKALRQHERLHSDEKRYVCQICGEGFAQFAKFLVHKRSHKGIK